MLNPFQLQDEPPLQFGRLWALDGNNSLKRIAPMGNRVAADTRVFNDSDYYLPPSFVNIYANEVKKKPAAPVDTTSANDPANDPTPDDHIEKAPPVGDNVEGDPTDGSQSKPLDECTRNWKSAAADDKKKMWAIFEETGIFASACRHGLILWIADMIRSGEL